MKTTRPLYGHHTNYNEGGSLDDDEFESLVSRSGNDVGQNYLENDSELPFRTTRAIINSSAAAITATRSNRNKFQKYHRYVVWILLITMTVTAILIVLPDSPIQRPGGYHQLFKNKGKTTKSALDSSSANSFLPVSYQCPHEFTESQEYQERDYENDAASITDNVTEYLSTFRDEEYDDWGFTYSVVKDNMYHFKSKYFPKMLEGRKASSSTPLTIYESASGIGLNLFMTLEILHELGIDDVTVYGNEYLEVSTLKSINLLNYSASKLFNSHVGILCQGDSTKLDKFVPPNAFDLVYTGYLTPLVDPLHFDLGEDGNYEHYTDLCYAKNKTDWKGYKLNEVTQQIQNDWYGLWVSQMIRIAKPGAPVIIEEISSPYCSDMRDWGGVSRDWWYGAAKKYDWDIDIESIEMEGDTVFSKLTRYHVFMRKNK